MPTSIHLVDTPRRSSSHTGPFLDSSRQMTARQMALLFSSFFAFRHAWRGVTRRPIRHTNLELLIQLPRLLLDWGLSRNLDYYALCAGNRQPALARTRAHKRAHN